MWTDTVRNGEMSGVDTAARLLQVLTLLGTRPWWSGEDLAERLQVTERTVRRDVTRLRELGYPIEAVTGRHGGYRLGSGGKLPPLLLDDDEAVAVAVGLRVASGAGGDGIDSPALSALAKLDQVLPPQLRERVRALRTVTVGIRGGEIPEFDADALVALAVACRRPERISFDYRDGAGRDSSRAVEPYRLVHTHRAWYLVAFDRDREAWRSFRVDRMREIVTSGVPFAHRADAPDPAAFVSEGIAVSVFEVQARVRFHCPAERARRMVARTVGVVEHETDETSIVRIGGDADWIARYLAGVEVTIEVLEPTEVKRELRALARRLLREHR